MTALPNLPVLPTLAAGDERKRLGQFFTGDRVSRLLAALADGHQGQRIIDPMAGSGDLLAACLDIGAVPEVLAAIDVDARALAWAEDRLSSVGPAFRSVAASAFDPKSWRQVGADWDLIITNPPYVRYQLNTTHRDLPDASDIRAGLLECIADAPHLCDSETRAFLEAAQNYSGLADLAVPCWILCLAQVRVGGRVAMLVPNTWMSRQYAKPVTDLLRRFFTVEVVVEDGNASWFSDALVRTTLVVATRVTSEGHSPVPAEHWQVRLHTDAGTEAGIVSAAVAGEFGSRTNPERAFVRALRAGQAAGLPGVHVTKACDARLTGGGGTSSGVSTRVHTLPELLMGAPNGSQVGLEDLGWSVGQGLRSGANDFFYVSRSGGTYRSPLLLDDPLSLPAEAVRALVFRQSELRDRRRVGPQCASSGVLVLDQFVHPDDATLGDPRTVMTGDLLRLVDAAAHKTYDRAGTPKPLPELTAVAPNVRARGPRGLPTFWYHLPQLTDRHTPALFLPRVNDRSPRAVVNANRSLVVDANFTSLWPANPDALTSEALHAIMNSAWVASWLESSCTVMGGGALKVEAADLRRMPLPHIDENAVQQLHNAGSGLIRGLLEADEASRTVASVLGYDVVEHMLMLDAQERWARRNSR